MSKEEIGFTHGVPDNPDRKWEKVIHGVTFVFSKTRDKKGHFTYSCFCGSAKTGWISDRDLSPEEIESARQFESFISGYTPR